MTLRAYVVDDEPLAVERLVRLLEQTERVTVTGATTHPEEAQAFLRQATVDVVFLDICMPSLTGFELLAGLPAPPTVVFSTAFDEFALKAFQVGALDYLLKPVQPQELTRALDRVEHGHGGPTRLPDLHTVRDALASVLRAQSSHFPERLASRLGERICFVDVPTITHLYAEHKLTYAVAGGKTYCLDAPLTDLEQRLDPSRFIRIHRGTLVNARWVSEMHAGVGGNLILQLRDEKRTRLTVSRSRAAEVKARLGV